MTPVLRINPADNVAVAILPQKAGTIVVIDNLQLTVREDIPAGHKIALKDFGEGENIIKYGYPIGHALAAIKAGAWVNEKNIRTNLAGLLDYEYHPVDAEHAQVADKALTFKGYRRANGQVGIRNEVWIIPTVGCVNGIASQLAERLKQETEGKGVDAIVAFPHNYGCSQLGDDHENTKKILRNMVLHPNAGAVLVVGLGCENNQPDVFREFCKGYDPERVQFVVSQKIDGDEVEYCMPLLRELYRKAAADVRTDIPLAELRVGLKCGGSDGFSGITANPLLGMFSDFLVGQGGTSVLTEVPEMFGAETILMNRCLNTELFNQTVSLINNFKEYFLSHGEPVGENPSPGNKAGGISTLEEKALGCTQKCGKAPVTGVMQYGERLQVKGLNLLSAPGNDLVASTALAAAGCHLVLFTTGRGTPFGTFVPTIKVSTNSALAKNKPTWIDFNAGTIVEDEPAENVLTRFIDFIIRVASGEPTNNERKGYHEIAIFKTGVTL
ncbi:MAG: altronate dehydratase family protein [Paludibacter sp.]|nr:altronate dehydratase family protein [Bacteroidales bacterium]MCM1068640.1 altronate dehydratase family protein [Prevotella sp.]MCM1353304.1 altronate dehydratase family protein [Bacteroides sp.]MCM1442288.1 altronate dehydratase family protein [Muribaculum sp.]MCM1481107.1 altronate dehydratase family protein [Paludibacter sp.]